MITVLMFINIITTLAVCLCAGALMQMRDDIEDRITELSMIECEIIKYIPAPDEDGDGGEETDGDL